MSKKNKITVVIVNDFDYVQGGASKVSVDTAKILQENGYRVIFFSGTHSDDLYVDYGYQNITLNMPEALNDKNKIRGAFRGLYNWKAKKELKKLLMTLDRKNTIVHIHGWTKTLSCSVFDILFKLKFKTVLTLHDYFTACPNGGYFNFQTNKVCSYRPLSTKCIGCNCDSRNYVFKIYRIVRTFIQNYIVKLNKKLKYGICVSFFSANLLKKTLSDHAKLFHICNPVYTVRKHQKIEEEDFYLYVGRVCREKGVHVFCDAMTKYNLKGIVIGNGEILPSLKEKYPNITFLGWQGEEIINSYMRKANALIFPSLCYETAGLTVVEAGLNGLPSIVADTSAAVEFVQNYGIGEVFVSGDIDSLYEKIKVISKNGAKSKKVIQKISEDYCYQNHFKELEGAYKYILSDKE